MRIREAFKFHFQKHLLSYGIVSGVLCFIGGVFIPDVIRAIYKVVNHSFGWTLGIGIGYAVLIGIIAIPLIMSVAWIIDRRERK